MKRDAGESGAEARDLRGDPARVVDEQRRAAGLATSASARRPPISSMPSRRLEAGGIGPSGFHAISRLERGAVELAVGADAAARRARRSAAGCIKFGSSRFR
jgi:hypothetical protein